MLNGLFSLIGLSWGNGGMSVEGPSEHPSFPAYGTLIQNHPSSTRPISQNGSYVTYNGVDYPNTNWDVNELADGVGGSFFDWNNSTFVAYLTGTFTSYGNSSADIVINNTSYGSACYWSGDVEHNGNGGYNEINQQGGCTGSGTYITSGSSSTSITINGIPYTNGYIPITYRHDGSGGYYSVEDSPVYYSHGTWITNGSVPLYLNLYTNTGSYYVGQFQNGTADVEYLNDGYGSFYQYTLSTYYTESGFITEYYFQTNVNGQMHNDGRTAVFYFQPSWNNYYSIAEYLNYYQYGTYIWDDGYASYFWEGNGGYYTNYNA